MPAGRPDIKVHSADRKFIVVPIKVVFLKPDADFSDTELHSAEPCAYRIRQRPVSLLENFGHGHPAFCPDVLGMYIG